MVCARSLALLLFIVLVPSASRVSGNIARPAVAKEAVSSEVVRLEQRVVSATRGSHLVDFTDVLCSPGACTPMVRGMVAYQDGDHLTARMTATLAPMLLPALDSAVAEGATPEP